jgi:hypothetical protein
VRTADLGLLAGNVDLGTLAWVSGNGDARVGRRRQLSFVRRVVKVSHPHVAEQVVAYPAPPTGPACEQVRR